MQSHLETRKLVLCDRYADSTYAYQGARLESLMDDPIRFLQRASESWMLRPDLTILLRVPPGLARKRIEGRPNLGPFEDLAFLNTDAATVAPLPRARRLNARDRSHAP